MRPPKQSFHLHDRRRRGFTLIEALVAGVVLAMSALAIGGAIAQSLAATQLSRDYQQAAELSQQIMTRVDIIGPARLLLEGPLHGEFDPPMARFTWNLEIDERLVGHLFEIVLTVRWQSGDRERSIEVATLLNDPPDSRPPFVRWEDLP
jgi:type II secretory pathway pseudopilin PulG